MVPGLECNPSSSLNQERKATVKTVADSSSLELPNEWRLLLPATGTKAPLSINSSETTQLCRYAGLPAQVQDTTGSTNVKIMEVHAH